VQRALAKWLQFLKRHGIPIISDSELPPPSLSPSGSRSPAAPPPLLLYDIEPRQSKPPWLTW
jgi:hypothetical protein